VSENAFVGKPEQPGDSELSAVLGPSRALWDQLLDDLSSEDSITGWKWHSYSVKAGWSLRLQRKQRNILYLVPRRGGFLAAFVFGEKALEAIRAGKFPRTVTNLIDGAKKYPEGTGVRLEVKSPQDVATVKRLAAIKVKN
jgi:hypothetical protein